MGPAVLLSVTNSVNGWAVGGILSRKVWVMCLCGVVIVLVAEGLRRGLGLFLIPMSEDVGFSRQYFGLILAVQSVPIQIIRSQ